MWLQIQNWSIKKIDFRKYFCRTLGNCCRLYGTHWETSAMIITCFVIKPWSHANNNNNICKLSTNLHSCTLGTSPLPPREFPFLRPLWWVVSQTLGANLLFGHLGHLRRWLEQAGGCVHHLGRVCEMWSTAASPVVSPTSQSSLNLQLAHRAPSVSPRHPVCCSVQLCAAMCSYVQLCATMCNYMQLCAAMCNYVQLYATVCNCVQLCAAMCNYQFSFYSASLFSFQNMLHQSPTVWLIAGHTP